LTHVFALRGRLFDLRIAKQTIVTGHAHDNGVIKYILVSPQAAALYYRLVSP
jgi:hypothetical protein